MLFSIILQFKSSDKLISINALLDSGADTNFLSLEVAKELNLTIGERSTGHLGNNSTFELFDCPNVSFYTENKLHIEKFKISDKLAHSAVLGLPFWIKNKISFNYDQLTCSIDDLVIPLHGATTSGRLFNLDNQLPIPDCLKHYSQVFSEKLGTKLPPHQDMDIKIDFIFGKTPTHGRTIQLSASQSRALKDYLDEQLSLGFMSPSTSSCSSPIFFVKKKNEG